MNMNLLKQYIRNIILEVYELSDEDIARVKNFKDENGVQRPIGDFAKRALGLQDKETIKQDRAYLTDYSNRLPDNIKKEFMNPKNITIAHSINYDGYAVSMGAKASRTMLPHRWVKKYGMQSRDQLSTVAVWGDILNNNIPNGKNLGGNPASVLYESRFFWVLKGYPVFIAKKDMMTQTLGALPKGLVNHQKSSGVAKRVSPNQGSFNEIINLDWIKNIGFAEEVILDNWQIIGGGINLRELTLLEFKDIAESALEVLPEISIYIDGNNLGKINKNSDLEEFFNTVYDEYESFWDYSPF